MRRSESTPGGDMFFPDFRFWVTGCALLWLCPSPVSTEQECRAYYDLNGKVYHESFTCPLFCCGNAFVKYCCDDPLKTSVVRHYDALSSPSWFVAAVLGVMMFGMVFTGCYVCCFLCQNQDESRASGSKSKSESRRNSTTATAISIDSLGEEHTGNDPPPRTPVTSQPEPTSTLPPYGAPSFGPPPYDDPPEYM